MRVAAMKMRRVLVFVGAVSSGSGGWLKGFGWDMGRKIPRSEFRVQGWMLAQQFGTQNPKTEDAALHAHGVP
jgi:hypothetical protein